MATKTASRPAVHIAPASTSTRASFLKQIQSLVGDHSAVGPAAISPAAGFDCSGLVYYALGQIGVKNPPRTSESQFNWVDKINLKQLKPGDLVFTQWPGDNSAPGHVQIYIGGGKLIQSPGNATGSVSITSLAQDAGHIVGYGRIPANGQPSTKQGNWTTAIWADLALRLANVYAPQGAKKIPITQNNISNMQRWIAAESGHANWWSKSNPLNSTGYGQSGGKYPSLTEAAQAFGQMLNQSNFTSIRKVLAANAPTSLFSAAVVKSPWASGHYGGNPLAIAHTSPNTTKGPTLTALNLAVSGNSPQVQAALKMDLGKTALGDVAGPALNKISDATGLTAIGSDFAGLAGILSDLTSSAWWKRVGIFALGGVLVIGGVVVFLQSTKTVQGAEGAALKVV